MVKFLRKYNKYILVVGGSLLMIAFLVPQAFNTLIGDPSRMTYAKLGGEEITLGEHDRVQRKFSALDDFAPGLIRGELLCEDADHWMLLVREATAAGLVGEAGDGATWQELNSAIENLYGAEIARSMFGDQAQAKLADPTERERVLEMARQRMARQKAEAAASRGLTLAEFDQALAEAHGVFRLRRAFLDATRFSDLRATALKAQRFEGVVIETLLIPASRIAFAMPEPSEDEIKAHFEKYRDAEPMSGEQGFGYRLPPRVKLEWLAIDRSAIEKVVPGDAVEANKRWRSDRKKYPGEFLAEQARVEADIRRERVDKIVAEIDVHIRNELKRAAARLEADGPYRKLPPDWDQRRPKLEDVARGAVKAVKENSGIDIPLPTVTVHASSWLTEIDIYGMQGIGAARVSLGGGRGAPLAPLIFAAREFERTDLGSLEVPLQVGLTSGDLVATDGGTRYYFTILDHRLASAPDSIDEVRAKVVEDLKRLAAFERLKANLPSLEAVAGIAGTDEVKKTIDAEFPLPEPADPAAGPDPGAPMDIQITRRQFVPRHLARSDNPNTSPEFRSRVFSIGDAIDPTKPIKDVPVADRVASAVIPRTMSVQVAIVVGVQPATFEVVRATGDQRLEELKQEQMAALIRTAGDPFTFEALKARWKYKVEELSDSKPFHMPSPKRS